MPRIISFSKTIEAFRERRKTVTRRIGWTNLKPDTFLNAVEKAQGLKKGEKMKWLGGIIVKDIRREPLADLLTDPDYGKAEMIKEGFPGMNPREFIKLFPEGADMVTRIEFEYT